ncbi:MAG: hypothetical protein NTY77_08285 [Elusimicrobia bacterium]|nr:hypothetical protein [Elusimicrobiota bacterium]
MGLRKQKALILALVLGGALYVAIVAAAAKLLVNLGLKLYLGVIRVPFSFALRLVWADGKTYIFLALALAAAAGYGLLRRRLAAEIGGPRWLRWCLPAATVLAVMAGAPRAWRGPGHAETNRYAFYTPFGLSRGPYVIPSGKPGIPDSVIQTNSFGYRDKEWSARPRPGVRRAIVVGDSNVWGYGIPTEDGMLHRKLELELDALDSRKWEVLDIANTPAALWYYVHALIAAGQDVHPDLYVMSFLGYYDLEPWEVQRVKFGLPQRLVDALDECGVSRDLMRMGVSLGGRYSRRHALDADTLADLQAIFSQLVAFIDETKGQLVIWEALGRNPFFDKYRGHPRVTFLGWSDVPELPEDLRRLASSDRVSWQSDETLSYRGDGHPTPKANGLIARAIAHGFFSRMRERRSLTPARRVP